MLKKALIVRFRNRIDVIPIREIIYLEKDLHRVRVHTEKGEYVFYARFDEIMPYLDVRFRRCHRSLILNYDRIEQLGDPLIRMDDSSELAFGKATLLRLKKDYETYVDWKIKKIREIDERAGFIMNSDQSVRPY